jgi:isoquinoline 1-oxidoreductase
MTQQTLDRRQFLKRMGLLGGGLVVYFTVGDLPASARTPRVGFLGAGIPTDFNAFLRIGADERVTLLTGKIEMGQGPVTSLPQMLADELDVPYGAVDIVMGDTDLCPWDAGTFGSLTTRYFGVFLREAAAEAKGVLKELAAERLEVPQDRLATENGVVYDKVNPSKRITYGALTKGNVIERHLDAVPELEKPSEFTVMGRSFLRRDAREKVTGKARYAADIRLPGMRYAKLLRPPAHGARLKRVDTAPAEKMDGVEVVREGDLIAVLHAYPDVAEAARRKIVAEFDTPKTGIDDKTIFDHLLDNAPAPLIVSEGGTLKTGKNRSARQVSETYLNSYVAHAPMEPHAATAQVDGGRVTVWASTQTPFRLREEVAAALNLAAEKVRVIPPFLGGGFGGKSASAQGIEAALLAKATGRPIQVAWSREEEFFFDTFRPAAVVKVDAGVDEAGRITFYDQGTYFAGQRGSELYYTFPHHRVAAYGEWMGPTTQVHPFAVGPWRAPAANTNVYARELHLNLLAEKAGADPLDFRLSHLKDKRMIGVLKAAAERFGWKTAPPPSGRGQGIACGIDAGTYVATMAAVSVDKAHGTVQVNRVVAAQDMGFVVNPDGAKMQMEGCITMGLGYALTEEIRFSDGKIHDTNFDTYFLPRFSWLPKIETVLVDTPGLSPQGGGEPAIVTMGGAIATAIHDAVGAAVFQLPMTPERVKAAMARG